MPKPLSERLQDDYGGKAIGNALQEAQTKRINQSIEEANALIKISSPRSCAEMIDSLVKFFFTENEGYFTKDENYAPEIRKIARSILAYINSLTNMQDIKAIYHQFEKHGGIKDGDFTLLAQEITDSTDEEESLLSIFRYFHITYTEIVSGEKQIKNPLVLITFSPTHRFFPEKRAELDLLRASPDIPSLGKLLPKIEEVKVITQHDTEEIISHPHGLGRNRKKTKTIPKAVTEKPKEVKVAGNSLTSHGTDVEVLESERQWIPVDTSKADAEREKFESHRLFIEQEMEGLKDFLFEHVPFLNQIKAFFELGEKLEELNRRIYKFQSERADISDSIRAEGEIKGIIKTDNQIGLQEAESDLRKESENLESLRKRLKSAQENTDTRHLVKGLLRNIKDQETAITKIEGHINRLKNPRSAKKKLKRIEGKVLENGAKKERILELDGLIKAIETEISGLTIKRNQLTIKRVPTLDEFNEFLLQSFGKPIIISETPTEYLITKEYPRNAILDRLIEFVEEEDIDSGNINLRQILKVKELLDHDFDEEKREEIEKFSQGKCSRYMIKLQSWILEKISQEIEITLPEIIEEALPEQNQRKSKNTRDIIPLKNTSITVKKGVKEVRRKKLLDEKSGFEREKRKYIFHYDEREGAIRKELIGLRSLSERVEDPRLLTIRELEQELQKLESNVDQEGPIISINQDEHEEIRGGNDELLKRKNTILKELRRIRNSALRSKKIIPKQLVQTQEEFNPMRIRELEEELAKIRATQKLQGAGVSMSEPEEFIKTKEEITAISRRKNIIRKKLIKLRGALKAQEASNLLLINELEEELKILSVIQDLRGSEFILSDQKEYTELKDKITTLSKKLRTIR